MSFVLVNALQNIIRTALTNPPTISGDNHTANGSISLEEIETIIRNSLIIFAITSIPKIVSSILCLFISGATDVKFTGAANTMHGMTTLPYINNSLTKFFIFVLSNGEL